MSERTESSDAPAGAEPDDRSAPRGPLAGFRVVELGQLLAGPFCSTLLAYYGAEVIKVEPPGGDPIRSWRVLKDGESLWWASLGRNKKSVTLDLRQERGRELARRLIAGSDVLVENFRPGTLEKWGLGPDELRRDNPSLIVARISGYGQTGPMARRPGYASVCEGFGGLRYVNGHPGEAPVRANLSLGDSLAGLHAAFGVLLALIERGRGDGDVARAGERGRGQDVDVGIFEAVYNLMEAVVPEYSGAGVVREPSGTTITGIVPTNTYRCSDGRFVIIGGNGESIFQRLMRAAGRPEMAEDPRFAGNANRVLHEEEIDRALAEWTATLTLDQALAALAEAEVPSGPIYSVREMMEDPQYRARGLFEPVEVGGERLEIPAIVPRLGRTPGATRWPGPKLGEHTREVLGELGIDAAALGELERAGVI
ncbi:MAG: CoA transferase [Acidobacteria bacterium]|nr:MAG: CoA transferase [Acidobacteriota bacterium]REK09592.1 MAG: CoA transferase [Acidobacteriota bacterium]